MCGNACAAGQTCTASSCVASAPPVSVVWTAPAFFRNPATMELLFPTYAAHLFDPAPTPTFPTRFSLVCGAFTNRTGTPQSVTMTVDMPVFAAARSTSVSVPANGTASRCISPAFRLSDLRALRTYTPGSLQVRASVGGTDVATAMQGFSIMPGNTALWSEQPPATARDMKALTAVFVQPNNADVIALRGEAERLSVFAPEGGGYGVAPAFEHARPLSQTVAVGTRSYQYEQFFMESGESVTFGPTAVSGGTDNAIDVYLMNATQFTTFTSGAMSTAEVVVTGARTGAARSFTATSDGWQYLVFSNLTSPVFSRTVTWSRWATRWDVAYDALRSVFMAMRARRLAYSHIGIADLSGIQYIRRPSEVLRPQAGAPSANCIEGSLVFASVFENVGFQPRLEYFQGCADGLNHAIVSVRMPGARYAWPIETTWVGSGQTPWEAHVSAIGNVSATAHASCLSSYEVVTLRALNIRPME